MNRTMDYKQRIKDDIGSATSYTRRRQHKHDAEMAVIRKGFGLVRDVHSVLDAPCGTGRASVFLARRGYRVTAVDLGKGAVDVTRQALEEKGLQGDVRQDDIENLSFGEREFDAVLCFRLFHHFPTAEIRRRVVDELCRVAGKYVLISYLSPGSFTSQKRRLQQRLQGKPIMQHATSLEEVTDYFSPNGFTLVSDIPQKRFFHSLHLAVFRRPD